MRRRLFCISLLSLVCLGCYSPPDSYNLATAQQIDKIRGHFKEIYRFDESRAWRIDSDKHDEGQYIAAVVLDQTDQDFVGLWLVIGDPQAPHQVVSANEFALYHSDCAKGKLWKPKAWRIDAVPAAVQRYAKASLKNPGEVKKP